MMIRLYSYENCSPGNKKKVPCECRNSSNDVMFNLMIKISSKHMLLLLNIERPDQVIILYMPLQKRCLDTCKSVRVLPNNRNWNNIHFREISMLSSYNDSDMGPRRPLNAFVALYISTHLNLASAIR